MRLERKYEAEAAHRLTAGVPEGHQCRRSHGHRYIFTVMLIGDVSPDTGMLMEYADVDKRISRVLDMVDHRDLNATLVGEPKEGGLAFVMNHNPTVENIARWFIAELRHQFPRENLRVGVSSFLSAQVYAVRVEEDSRSVVEVGAGEV